MNVGTISSEKDLDAAPKRNPLLMNATLREQKHVLEASKLCLDRMALAADEQWAMADSGAGVNGMAVLFRHATKRKRCIAANGGDSFD